MAQEALTPMMKQFYDLKAKHPEALLLFRCGDFYETYADDAVIASEILGITLTHRNNGKAGIAQSTAMAGFPYHALDTYLPKLVRAGKRVAICDQLEDPKLTKTLVKRGITELVTPGVTMADTVLNYKENNFLCAINFGKQACGMSLLDISTGEFLVTEGTTDYIDKLMASKSIYKCMSCMACIERCPRQVKPARLIEAIRLAVVRKQGGNHLCPDDVPALYDPDLPQQALVSAYRKFTK